MGAENPFDTISGTLGLTADPTRSWSWNALWTRVAILHLTGRDVGEQKYRLHRDAGIGSMVTVDTPVVDVSSSRQEILDALLSACQDRADPPTWPIGLAAPRAPSGS